MSVDIYVMPLSRYKSGDFRSPLQHVFGADNAKRVTPFGIEEKPKPDTITAALDSLIAKDEERDLQLFLAASAKAASLSEDVMTWNDTGEVCFAEQATHLEAASTYANWLGHQEEYPQFEIPDPDEFLSHPLWNLPEDPLSTEYPHLVYHDMYLGYFLPYDFPNLLQLPTDFEGVTRPIGSSFRLRAELKKVGETLGLVWQEHIGLVHPVREYEDLISTVVDALTQLSRAAEISCDRKLPIIFDG